MPKIESGYNRVVLLIGKWAIKLPNPSSQRQFILGMACNLKEYETYNESDHDPYLMEIYSIGYLGLWLVCKRYEVIQRTLTDDEIEDIPMSDLDPKIGNFGYENGHIVILDYGYSNCWYIG